MNWLYQRRHDAPAWFHGSRGPLLRLSMVLCVFCERRSISVACLCTGGQEPVRRPRALAANVHWYKRFIDDALRDVRMRMVSLESLARSVPRRQVP